MKNIIRKFEDLFIDVTFAEDREYAAIQDMAERLENIFVAVAFAEEGDNENTVIRRKPGKIITLKLATV